jgi:hypothetical protein
MTIAQLIILRNADAGIVFYRDGEALKWEPPVSFTREQLACIDRHKAGILAEVDANEADETLALLALPCAKLGPHESTGFQNQPAPESKAGGRPNCDTRYTDVSARAGSSNGRRRRSEAPEQSLIAMRSASTN